MAIDVDGGCVAWFLSWCACCWYWRFRPFRGFPGALAGLGGLQAGYKIAVSPRTVSGLI